MEYGSSFSEYFYHFPGKQTVLTFANGTEMIAHSYATANVDFTGVTDGKSFFSKFCTGPQASASASASASSLPSSTAFASLSFAPASSGTVSVSATVAASSMISTDNVYTPVSPSATAVPQLEFYPQAAMLAGDNSIGGYFPESQKDLAVGKKLWAE